VPRSARDALQPAAPPAPPPRQRRSKGLAGRLSGFFSFILFAMLAVGAGSFYLQSRYTAPGPLGNERVVLVPRGSGSEDIAQLLQQEGVIDQPTTFIIMSLLQTGVLGDKRLRAGEYLFRQHASLKDVIETLSSGRAIEHALTLPEGLTSEQIVQRLMENDVLVGDVREIPPEGSLLPDTYKFERGTTRDQFIERMKRQQQRVLAEVWQRRSPDIPVKTARDLVTLASIVEKETGRADERPRVASVFVNRLNRNMRLESDPTIIYGIVGGKGSLGRGILASEIRQATPYNTYVINGLPPGPIGNPGRAAMEAAANPARTRDLFFVADGTGGHAFAETYEQHQRNVARWRQIEREQNPGAAPPAAGAAPPAPVAPAAPPARGPQRTERIAPQPAPATAGARPAAPPVTAYTVPELPADTLTRAGLAETEGAAGPAVEGVDTYPVAPNRRTGLQRAVPGQPAPPEGAPVQGQRRNNVDAVAGTARDPLRNRTFDLNSPQTIPPLPALR
jgi:UPF0755 protein